MNKVPLHVISGLMNQNHWHAHFNEVTSFQHTHVSSNLSHWFINVSAIHLIQLIIIKRQPAVKFDLIWSSNVSSNIDKAVEVYFEWQEEEFTELKFTFMSHKQGVVFVSHKICDKTLIITLLTIDSLCVFIICYVECYAMC